MIPSFEEFLLANQSSLAKARENHRRPTLQTNLSGRPDQVRHKMTWPEFYLCGNLSVHPSHRRYVHSLPVRKIIDGSEDYHPSIHQGAIIHRLSIYRDGCRKEAEDEDNAKKDQRCDVDQHPIFTKRPPTFRKGLMSQSF